MAQFRFSLVFLSNGQRYTEGYVLDGQATLANARVTGLPMIKQRLKLCGHGVKLVGVRISSIPATRKIELILPNENEWQDPPAIAAADNGPEAQRSSSDILLAAWDASGRRSSRPFAGIPDNIISETSSDGLTLDRNAGWRGEYEKFKGILLNQAGAEGNAPWGFMGLLDETEGNAKQITAGSTDANTDELIVNVTGDQTGTFPVGTDVIISKNRRIVADFKGPNGQQLVKASVYTAATNTTAITLQGLTGVDPTRWLPGSYGFIRVRQATFRQFTKIKPVRATKRNRHVTGFTLVRGRGRVRKTI